MVQKRPSLAPLDYTVPLRPRPESHVLKLTIVQAELTTISNVLTALIALQEVPKKLFVLQEHLEMETLITTTLLSHVQIVTQPHTQLLTDLENVFPALLDMFVLVKPQLPLLKTKLLRTAMNAPLATTAQ